MITYKFNLLAANCIILSFLTTTVVLWIFCVWIFVDRYTILWSIRPNRLGDLLKHLLSKASLAVFLWLVSFRFLRDLSSLKFISKGAQPFWLWGWKQNNSFLGYIHIITSQTHCCIYYFSIPVLTDSAYLTRTSLAQAFVRDVGSSGEPKWVTCGAENIKDGNSALSSFNPHTTWTDLMPQLFQLQLPCPPNLTDTCSSELSCDCSIHPEFLENLEWP